MMDMTGDTCGMCGKNKQFIQNFGLNTIKKGTAW